MIARSSLIALTTAAVVTGAVGCSSSSTTSPPTSGSVSASPAAGLVLDITIAHGTVTPTNATVQAKVGQPIELKVDSDAEDELHVHSSPDHEFTVEPRAGQIFQFTIDVPGSVDVELHKLGKTVATIQVQ